MSLIIFCIFAKVSFLGQTVVFLSSIGLVAYVRIYIQAYESLICFRSSVLEYMNSAQPIITH